MKTCPPLTRGNFYTYDRYPFQHVVDDNGGVVYVSYHSFAGSMGAHTIGKKLWPGFRIRGMSLETINKIKRQFNVR